MKYTSQPKRRIPKRLFYITLIAGVIFVGSVVAVRYAYGQSLRAVSSSTEVTLVQVKDGASVDSIAKDLEAKKLIKSAWAFRLYVSSHEAQGSMKAGSYEFAPSQSVADIVAQLTRGKVATNLVTILPGQRLDQVRKRLIQDGFTEKDVDDALNPVNYKNNPALVDKPAGATLEGYLYPDSYQRIGTTTASDIITDSLEQMNKHLTPDLRSAFAKQGLSTYQGIILASMVEKEVSKTADRQQVAQVFLKRIALGMPLQSDPTAFYGAILAGQKPSTHFDSAYNTYTIKGLPPTPISNVSVSSLDAVAHPANTNWVYFVAGDDGNTYFSDNLQTHQANVRQYCTKLCGQ